MKDVNVSLVGADSSCSVRGGHVSYCQLLCRKRSDLLGQNDRLVSFKVTQLTAVDSASVHRIRAPKDGVKATGANSPDYDRFAFGVQTGDTLGCQQLCGWRIVPQLVELVHSTRPNLECLEVRRVPQLKSYALTVPLSIRKRL